MVEAGLLSNGLIRILEDDYILPFAVPVIYNICVDYGKDFSTGTVQYGRLTYEQNLHSSKSARQV